MIDKIRKRSGKIVNFEKEKIVNAIFNAAKSVGGEDYELAKKLGDEVVEVLKQKLDPEEIPTVEQIQDIVEKVLVENGHYKTAKSYILYRKQHEEIRRIKDLFSNIKIIENYLDLKDWRVKENANMTYSLQGLNFHVSSVITAQYWLNKIYPVEIKQAHLEGDFHIHDLGILGAYCVGWDLQDLLLSGFKGVRGKIESKPPKHFRAALGQVVNFFYTLQGEAAGAQAFSFDAQTPITIRRNGEIESITLEMLFEDYKHQARHLNESEVIFTENIYREYLLNDIDKRKYLDSRLPTEPVLFQFDKIEVLTEKGFMPLRAISRHKIKDKNDELLIVETEDGNVLRVSRSHPMILADGSIKRADKLAIGDEILSSDLKIDLSEKIELESDFAYLIGFMIAEGCWGHQTREYSIISQKKDTKERKKVKNILNKLKIPHFENGEFNIVFGTTSVGRFIRNHLRLQEGSYKKNLPQFIFSLKKKNIGDLISGLIDGDGDVDRKRVVRIHSTSYTLLMQLKQVLGILGINSTVRFAFYKNAKENYKDGYVIRFRVREKDLSFFKQSIKLSNIKTKTKESPKFSSKVVKVTKAKYDNEFVYDITTDNEHFLINNIVVHNSNFDTLLAPFIRYDKLSYPEVKQAIQEFLFNINVPTRVGFQTPFTNITLDLTVPEYLANMPVIVGGKPQSKTYGEFQEEINIFNNVLAEVMIEGDANNRVFTFPIPTYNITKDFKWENKNYDKIFEMTSKYGIPYFANFINSEMKPDDVRSMCCRLRIDNRILQKRGGGLFGANPLTGCYDEKTEVLTEKGWKQFRDLTLDDEVFTLSKDNKIELHKPVKLFVYDWDGNLYRFKAKSLDLLVTPNHKMVVDDARTDKRKLVKAENFDVNNHRIPKQGKWIGQEVKYFVLPEIKNKWIAGNHQSHLSYEKKGIKILMDDWLKFFGFWLAEGSFDNEGIAPSHGYRVFITQTKKETRRELRVVLEKLPFHFRDTNNGFEITNKQLWNYLKQFGPCYDKFVPEEIKKLSARQLKILFDWMVKGDGHIRPLRGITTKRQINYYTTSKRLADDLQEIIMKIGWLATISKRKSRLSLIRGRKIKSTIQYIVGVQQSSHYRLRSQNIKLEYYKGKVYSCEVTNHTLFVRRNGKCCWSGNSIGVVTINMPRLGFLSRNKEEFFERLEKLMNLAKESLEIKRKTLENLTEKGLYPYSKFYLRDIKKRFGNYWKNHFSTIGLVGMNECCLNFLRCTIGDKEGVKFAEEVMDFMRDKLIKFQEETGNNYNLEATPAEGTSYRLARIDKKKYPDIICADEKEYKKGAEPFYTNSSQLPVNYTDDVFEALELQDELQTKYTGGTVIHIFLGEKKPTAGSVKSLVRKVCENFSLPYFTITPTFSICPIHGYIFGEHPYCPKCEADKKKTKCEVYSRVVGYLRPVDQWNKGKQEEFKQRKTFDKSLK